MNTICVPWMQGCITAHNQQKPSKSHCSHEHLPPTLAEYDQIFPAFHECAAMVRNEQGVAWAS